MNAITRWLVPPVFEGDEEKTRRAKLVNMIAISCIAFALVVMLGALLGGKTPISTLIIDLVACGLILQILRWLRSGRVTLARVGIVIVGLVYLTGVTASLGTIRTPTAAIFVFWVLMTGLLFDLRGIVLGTIAASLAVWGLIVAENAGSLRQPYYGVGLTQWITLTALFGFTSGLTYYIIQGTTRALSRAEKEVAERKQAEQALLSSKKQYDDLVSKIPFGTYILRSKQDGSFALVYVSPKAAELFNASEQSLLADATVVFQTIHPDDRDTFVKLNQEGIEQLRVFEWSGRTQSEGKVKFLRIESSPDRQANGDVLWHGIVEDITERRRLEDEVRQLAFHDTVTNLPNRRLLLDHLNQAMAASKRSGRYCALIFLDLDNFKLLNDTHGHEAGDLLLIEVTRRLTNSVREVDTVSRFGGDEFAVLLSDLNGDRVGSAKEVQIVAEKIRVKLAEPYLLAIRHEGNTVTTVEHRCSASIGAVVFMNHECSQDDILRRADTAMYQAKDAGRNTVVFHQATDEV